MRFLRGITYAAIVVSIMVTWWGGYFTGKEAANRYYAAHWMPRPTFTTVYDCIKFIDLFPGATCKVEPRKSDQGFWMPAWRDGFSPEPNSQPQQPLGQDIACKQNGWTGVCAAVKR